MARTTREIYEAMVRDKESRAELSELTNTSSASIWRMLLWVVASAVNVAEQLWDIFRRDVEKTLAEQTAHRVDWYAWKATQFVSGLTLIPGKDTYDLSMLSDQDIERHRIVKYAAAIENKEYTMLYVKVAGEKADGKRAPLNEMQAMRVEAYLNEVKDVGVRITLVNKEADTFKCAVRVLYDPILDPDNVREAIEKTIKDYVENLAFNGEYSNMALIDAVQKVDGVKIAEVESAVVAEEGGTERGVNLRYTPVAGYMKAEEVVVNLEPYSLYADR